MSQELSKEQRRVEKRKQERQLLASHDTTAQYAPWLDAHEAAEALGFTKMHTKSLGRDGKIKSIKIKFRGYTKRLFEPSSVNSYESKSFGPTGMRRYILRVDPDHVNIEDIREHLSATYGVDGLNEDTGDVIWTLRKPKSSKSKKDKAEDSEPFVPTIAGAGLPPEPTEPTQVPSGDAESDE